MQKTLSLIHACVLPHSLPFLRIAWWLCCIALHVFTRCLPQGGSCLPPALCFETRHLHALPACLLHTHCCLPTKEENTDARHDTWEGGGEEAGEPSHCIKSHFPCAAQEKKLLCSEQIPCSPVSLGLPLATAVSCWSGLLPPFSSTWEGDDLSLHGGLGWRSRRGGGRGNAISSHPISDSAQAHSGNMPAHLGRHGRRRGGYPAIT